ncbi:hypothetical protein F5Y17DRAFT_471021 [Xylariaceae sp. FL0594]|nr:hypothetical protein F5Y17DRAFT_471021 [Xylariaceae sp. FL0594]
MPKWDKTRNYYADLELSSTATTDEVRKQFRKLALKYHPDRNPGREVEFQSKFQIIQSAHEILTDDALRKQYDEARRTRFPSASGVRGNPWQDAAKAYPPPPRRPNTQARPASGAQRYESFTANYASGASRHSRPQTPKDDPQFRQSNADAWERMRPNSTRRRPQPPPSPPTPGQSQPRRAPTSAARDNKPGPVPVPPRTAYQKQKAEAAFGTSRKTGFTPSAPGVADEPPVTNKNYFTTRTHSAFAPEPAFDAAQPTAEANSRAFDPVAGAEYYKQRLRESLGRQSTPYHSPGGEKTSLFDGATGLGRSASTRMPRPAEMPGTSSHQRPRSSSPARSSSNDGSSEYSSGSNPGARGAAYQHGTTTQPSKASERYTPKTAGPNTNNPPPGYAQPIPSSFRSPSSAGATQPSMSYQQALYARLWASHSQPFGGHVAPASSSEDRKPLNPNSLLPLEMQQRAALDRLVGRLYPSRKGSAQTQTTEDSRNQHAPSTFTASSRGLNANSKRSSSFAFAAETKPPAASADPKPFTRHSTDNIDTRFVDDEIVDDWQFTAGSVSASEASEQRRPRSQPRNRPIRRPTPLTNPFTPPRVPPAQAEAQSTNSESHTPFSARNWSEQIGPQHFEPQPTNSSSTSPQRRPHLSKSRSFRTPAGKTSAVNEEEVVNGGPQQQSQPQPPPPPPRATSIAEEDAMDIDSPHPPPPPPPPPRAEHAEKPAKVNNARNYSSEPYRAEWRAGDTHGVPLQTTGLASSTNDAKDAPGVNGTKPAAVNPTFPAPNRGSEDSEEFHTTFAEFKNVEPIAEPRRPGLGSFEALKFNLPFQSRPSEQMPNEILNPTPAVKPLKFPTIPVAPRVPPPAVPGMRPSNASFRKYSADFETYMEKWEAFEDEIISHITTRQREYKTRRRLRGVKWLESGAPAYLAELDQDIDVQRKYGNACVEHRKRVAEYMEFRDRIK